MRHPSTVPQQGGRYIHVFPTNIEQEIARCLERREWLKRKESIEQFFCPVLAKEAARLRNLSRR